MNIFGFEISGVLSCAIGQLAVFILGLCWVGLRLRRTTNKLLKHVATLGEFKNKLQITNGGLKIVSLEPKKSEMLKHFDWRHLPEALHPIYHPFDSLARRIDSQAANEDEKAVALRHLLDARAAFIRSITNEKSKA